MVHQAELGDEQIGRLDALVDSGGFVSREEALEWAIERLAERQARLRAVEAHIEEGLADVDAGRLYSLAEVRAHLRQPQGA